MWALSIFLTNSKLLDNISIAECHIDIYCQTKVIFSYKFDLRDYPIIDSTIAIHYQQNTNSLSKIAVKYKFGLPRDLKSNWSFIDQG